MTDSLKATTAVNKLQTLGYRYAEGGVWVNDPSPKQPTPWDNVVAGFWQPATTPPVAPDDSDINQVHAANAQVRYETWTPPKTSTPTVPGPSGDYLSDFQEGQWWLAELDAAVVNGTHDQKCAVAVVRNLLATVAANTLPAAPAQEPLPNLENQPVHYWLPMEEAPTDGTLVRIFVQFTENSLEDASIPVWTIGCNFSDHQDDKEWLFAGWNWSHDCFTSGKGKPIGWLPMLEANIATPPKQPAPVQPALFWQIVAQAWDEGYLDGVADERTSEANIGIAGLGAKVEPARNNPYRTHLQERNEL